MEQAGAGTAGGFERAPEYRPQGLAGRVCCRRTVDGAALIKEIDGGNGPAAPDALHGEASDDAERLPSSPDPAGEAWATSSGRVDISAMNERGERAQMPLHGRPGISTTLIHDRRVYLR